MDEIEFARFHQQYPRGFADMRSFQTYTLQARQARHPLLYRRERVSVVRDDQHIDRRIIFC